MSGFHGTRVRCSYQVATLAAALGTALGGAAALPAAAVEERIFGARETPDAIRVDGRLDEPAWSLAEAIALPFEIEPGENVAAPVATSCRVLFEARRLLVGCVAEDPQPATIRARFTDRDGAFDDDFVGVRLDPFLDRRRAFEFYVNPLGVQMDLFRDDLGNDRFGDNEDESWDAIWDSAGEITASGYAVEIAIPFSSLRFPRSLAEQRWGVSFARVRPRRDRAVFASEPSDRNRSCTVCQYSTLEGLAGISPGRNLELDPTLTVQRADRRVSLDGPLEAGSTEVEGGLTLGWGVTPDVVLNAAANPDFSQVEADALELDVNRQFAIFYPERRPFFLEGADLLATPFQVVFTRNVADPDWGLKATGKLGRSAFAAFVAGDARTSLLIPGSRDSDLIEIPGDSRDAAARYRHDVGPGSALGVVATSRRGDGYANDVAGIDGLMRWGTADAFRFQVLGSRTRDPAAPDRRVEPSEDHALLAAWNHDSRDWRLSAQYQDVGRDFRADLGFLPQVDYRYGKLLAEHTFWARPEARWLSFRLGIDSARTEDQSGETIERLDEIWIILHGRRQLELFVQAADRERTFQGEAFRESYVEGHASLRPSRSLELDLHWNLGDTVDLAGLRPATQVLLAPAIAWSPGRHLRTTLQHQVQRLEVDAGRLFTARLTELRTVWQFDIRSFARVILQHRDLARDPALHATPVARRERRLFSQLLYSYRLNPQTVLFAGYSDTRIDGTTIESLQLDRTFFAKLGYAWRP